MRTAQEVREYLEGVRYPARPEDLIAIAQANGAPPSFFETLGLVPTAVEFYNPTLARWRSSWSACRAWVVVAKLQNRVCWKPGSQE